MKNNISKYISAFICAGAILTAASEANSMDVAPNGKFEQNLIYFSAPSLIPMAISSSLLSLDIKLGSSNFGAMAALNSGGDDNIQTGAIPGTLVDPGAVRVKKPKAKAGNATNAVFGTVAFPLKRLGALKKFGPSFSQMVDGSSWNCGKKGCNAATLSIKAAATRVAGSSLRDKLNDINATVNTAIRYSRDSETYKTADRWAKPSETLKRQTGDCEDFAILKMAALHAGGVSLEDMAIVVLYDHTRRFYHAVLSVSAGNRYYILDNMRNAVLTDDKLASYVPLYSIKNGRGYFHGIPVSRSKQLAANAVSFEKISPGEGLPL